MSDWKGLSVFILVIDTQTGEEIGKEDVLLDTDTMADLFEQYPPQRYCIAVLATELKDKRFVNGRPL